MNAVFQTCHGGVVWRRAVFADARWPHMLLAAGSEIPEHLMRYEVVSGLVELRLHRPDGSAPLVRLCLPGSQICPSSLEGYAAIARLPTSLRQPRCDDHQAFAQDVGRVLPLHLPQTAVTKLWRLLLLYQSAFSTARGTTSYVLPLSTSDFASALGVELRTVSRAIGILKRAGLITKEACGVWRLTPKDEPNAGLVPITAA